MAGIAQRRLHPFTGPSPSGTGQAVPDDKDAVSGGQQVFGIPIEDVTKQEVWKHREHGLDCWERMIAHADANKLPDEENTFRFRFHGMFFVGPAQNSFMLRCRIPAGELTSAQLAGLADIAESYGNGKAAITTRSNIQIREIEPKNLINTLTKLQQLGLTSKGSGVDNVRNITASPTAGIDPQELIDTRPFAHALHHHILNQRDLYNLPRKFNVAFEGGGSVDTVADTNDIGFMACRVDGNGGGTLRDGTSVPLEPGVYFRVELCGITGHRQLATDCGLIVKPADSVALAVAMLRVFIAHGDRTDRKKARLKYLVDKWGVEQFLEETQKRLPFPLVRLPIGRCVARPAPIKHGHLGVFRQKQRGLNYVGVAIPVGVMTVRQMRRIAELATNYGSGSLRLTPWQNLLVTDVADGFVETLKRNLVRMGFHHEATSIKGGLIACTGSTGCKWASTDTKGHALALASILDKHIQLDHPINIHLTGCPHSCAQHYVGDIGLQGVKTKLGGETVEGYNIVFGGGTGLDAAIGRQVFTGIPFSEIPELLKRVLTVFIDRRSGRETFSQFIRRHEVGQLQDMFSN